MTCCFCSFYGIIGIIFLYKIIKWVKRSYFTKVSFQHKVVWITGASSGIGEYLTYKFSDLGAFLIISSRQEKELERVKKNCKFPDQVYVFPFDLSNPEEVSKKVNKFLEEKNFPIDILINNGGMGMRIFCLENTLENDIRLMNVNFFSAIAITRAVLPGMMRRNNGQIILISSIQGKLGIPKRSTYAASKHALHGFFDSLRAELCNTNINVNLICPGYVKTNISNAAIKGKDYDSNKIEKNISQGMDSREFAEIATKSIFLRDNEVIITNKFTHRIAIILRNILPDLMFKIIANLKE